MTLVSELELAAFDHTDAQMRGERFHEAMAQVRAQGWLAECPFGYMTLDREAGEFFLRTRSAIFPGMKIAEIFGVTEGPLFEQMRRNILRGRARALTFGAGVHYCLGANLARVELQKGLAFLAEHMHDLRLDGEPVFEGVSGIYGLAELPIAFAA